MRGLTIILGGWMLRCGTLRRWSWGRGVHGLEFYGDGWNVVRFVGPFTALRRMPASAYSTASPPWTTVRVEHVAEDLA